MKIRIDFVTNSSSSSFILARKGEITEEQKNAVIDYIVKKMLGDKILASEDVKTEVAMEEKVANLAETDYWFEEKQNEIKEVLKSGKDIYVGTVNHEKADGYYCDLFENIWRILEKNSNGNFEAIQDDLSY